MDQVKNHTQNSHIVADDALIEVKDLVFFRGDRAIYNGVNMRFAHGQITGIMGPSGTGKTTLAIHLATLAELVGLPTVLIDLDPQASASAWKDGREADTPIVTPVPPTRLQQALEAAKEGKV